MDNLLLDSFTRLLVEVSTPAAVRHAERSGDTAAIDAALAESGFLDALVPEEKGGAGLSLADLIPLFMAAGEHLLPAPFAETIVARALIATSGAELPPLAPILLWPETPDGRLRSQVRPLAGEGALALVQRGSECLLLPTSIGVAADDPFRMSGAIPDAAGAPLLSFSAPEVDLLHWAAAITAVNMAGALGRVLDMSIAHVNERQQFGRSLGKFQAIQQQLSVLAERTVAAQVAARIGLTASGLQLGSWRVAVAKTMTNEAAGACAAIAHAVHGAIGISEEHDLQLYTRRLKRWQISFGSDSYWAKQAGQDRLSARGGTSVDFVRAGLGQDEVVE